MSVRTQPGQVALTRMRGASSRARIPGQRVERGLGHAVRVGTAVRADVRDEGVARQCRVGQYAAVGRGEVRERAEPARHVGDRGAVAQQRGEPERHAQRAEQVRLDGALDPAGAVDARVVDERVDPDRAVAELLRGRRDRRIAGHVELDRLDAAAGVLAQPRRRGLAFVAVAGTDEHVPAIAGEHARDLLPDPAVAAGDERGLASCGRHIPSVAA
jgi:hypothetical protein